MGDSVPEEDDYVIYVESFYQGYESEAIESILTRPIEQELKGIENIEEIRTISKPNRSVVMVSFEPQIPDYEALDLVSQAIDKAMEEPTFPSDLPSPPRIYTVDKNHWPVLQLKVKNKDCEIHAFESDIMGLREKIEILPDISHVSCTGLSERYVLIDFNYEKLEHHTITLNDIEESLSMGRSGYDAQGSFYTTTSSESLEVNIYYMLSAGNRLKMGVSSFPELEKINALTIIDRNNNPILFRDLIDHVHFMGETSPPNEVLLEVHKRTAIPDEELLELINETANGFNENCHTAKISAELITYKDGDRNLFDAIEFPEETDFVKFTLNRENLQKLNVSTYAVNTQLSTVIHLYPDKSLEDILQTPVIIRNNQGYVVRFPLSMFYTFED